MQGSARWRTGEESPAPTLMDSGSQAFAIAAPSLFLSGTLQPAQKPLAITSVEGDAVAGWTMGALLDPTVPVRGRHGVEGFFSCEQVFVYSAEVTNGCIVGYPFLKCYGLHLDASPDHLVDTLAEYSEPTVLREVETDPNLPPLVDEETPRVSPMRNGRHGQPPSRKRWPHWDSRWRQWPWRFSRSPQWPQSCQRHATPAWEGSSL